MKINLRALLTDAEHDRVTSSLCTARYRFSCEYPVHSMLSFVEVNTREYGHTVLRCDALHEGWVSVTYQFGEPLRPTGTNVGISDGEVRTTSATGGEKGVKPARFDLIPSGPLCQVAEHYGKGAAKYEDRNWERGYEWSKSFGAMQRHAWAFWRGETLDPETGSHHMTAVVFHALALIEFGATHPEFDDRVGVPA